MMLRNRLAIISGCSLAALGAMAAWQFGGAAEARQAVATCDTATTPFCNSTVPLPAGWTGRRFQLSQNYPTAIPSDAMPWKAFDPTTQSQPYIQAVLGYFYEGNLRPDIDASFDPTLNTVRHWYNAPWQDTGTNGREPIHGLTRERTSKPQELAPSQGRQWNNYAVGFYNAPGGAVIGRMWANRGKPNASAASDMPEGTVAAKLLFTTAPVSEVPYLQGSPEWDAYVYADVNNPFPKPTSPRAVVKVRLLQIDIAVKDARVASKTGWVFGTFVYGGGPGGPAGNGWTNVAPIGLMWGNDPGYSGTGPLTESWINPAVTMPHLGYQGRLNGPVDNKLSSCLSCHSTAETPAGSMMPTGTNTAPWFRNIPSGTAFDAGRTSLDYSLQLSVGLGAFLDAQKVKNTRSPTARRLLVKRLEAEDARPARDGGTGR
ncbi:MAG: hypothetical protein V4564_19190 [Pseudomonadota bacterium]